MSRKFSASCQIVRRGCWNCILRVQNNISLQNSFISNFFSILDTEQFFWPILAKKVVELSKLDSQFHWKLSGESFLQNLQIFIFLNIDWKTFSWLSEKSQRGFQAAFYLSMGTSWRKCLWKVFAIFCGPFVGSFPVIEQEIFGRPLKTAFPVSIKSVWEKKLFWKTNEFFQHFQTLRENFSASWRVFRRGCWNCILRVQNNISLQNSFISNFFSILDTEHFFWPILAKKVAELSKLDSQFQWRLSRESSLQNLPIDFSLNIERKVFGWLSGKSQRGFQAAFYFSMGTIWRKLFWKDFASSVDFFSDHFR